MTLSEALHDVFRVLCVHDTACPVYACTFTNIFSAIVDMRVAVVLFVWDNTKLIVFADFFFLSFCYVSSLWFFHPAFRSSLSSYIFRTLFIVIYRYAYNRTHTCLMHDWCCALIALWNAWCRARAAIIIKESYLQHTYRHYILCVASASNPKKIIIQSMRFIENWACACVCFNLIIK